MVSLSIDEASLSVHAAAAATAAIVVFAAAPTLASPESGGSRPLVESIEEADWRALVSGKTLYYSTPAGLVGREYYPPNSDRAIFIYHDGQCFDGTWREENGIYCFLYNGEHCFQHLRQGERIFVRELDGDTQDVVRITDEVLSCDPDLFSRATAARDAG